MKEIKKKIGRPPGARNIILNRNAQVKKINKYFKSKPKFQTINNEKYVIMPSYDDLARFVGFKNGINDLKYIKNDKERQLWIDNIYSQDERMIIRIYNFATWFKLDSKIVLHYLDRFFPNRDENYKGSTALSININLNDEQEISLLNNLGNLSNNLKSESKKLKKDVIDLENNKIK